MDVKRHHDRAAPVAGSEAGAACWCGGSDLDALRPDYSSCSRCGTLVYTGPYDPARHLSSGPSDFYGDRYWRHHVPRKLGLPGLEERARTDLPERAVFHLVRILEVLDPGSRVLEVGCGAGSLSYLLRLAGFEAEGLELGPAAIELGRRHFGLEIHRGPIEELENEASYDAIVGIDLLEHVPDPATTVKHCARRLRAGGLLLLQTPCYRGEGAGWEMLLPEEHLHLFTADSIERLLRASGLEEVEVLGSLFAHDMWVTASVGPLPGRRPDPLAGVSPVAVALIDAYAELTRTRDERAAVDSDRWSKERDLERLRAQVEALRDDQRSKEGLLRRQDRELRQVRSDQRAKGALIDRLSPELAAARADQRAKEELITALDAELEAGRSELEAVRSDQGDKAALIDRLSAELVAVRADQQVKELVISRLDSELRQAVGDLERVREELGEIHADRLYRFLRAVRDRLGRPRR